MGPGLALESGEFIPAEELNKMMSKNERFHVAQSSATQADSQPATLAAVASKAVLAAIRAANMQLVQTGDDEFMLVKYKNAEAQCDGGKCGIGGYCEQCPAARAPADSVTAPAGGVVAGPNWEALRHSANEWADMATNGLQWLRNIVDGVSDVKTALANMEGNLAHCRAVNDAPEVQAAIRAATTPPAQAADSVLEDAARWRAWADGMVEACAAPHGVTPPFMAAFEEAVGDSDTSFSVEQLNGWVDAARKKEGV